MLVVLVLFVFFSAVSKAERLPIKTYTVADGLLRDNVSKIKQDSRGFLWFCTVDGISRFDGYAFTNFTTNDGLPDRHVNDFIETKAGIIYVATDGGLARLNPTGLAGSKDNPLFTVILPDNERAKSIQVLYEDETGAGYAGTSDGLYKFNAQDTIEVVNFSEVLNGNEVISINTIIKDRRGAIWIGTQDNGLLRILPDGEVERFTMENGLPDAHIFKLFEDKNGRIWAGLSPYMDSGLCLLVREPKKNQNIIERVFMPKDGLPSVWITDLYEDGENFWVATTRGLCLWQGETVASVCKTYTAKNDLCDYDIWTIVKDKDGNLWTGSKCGAKKWARYGFTSYSEADGTANPLVNSIFENTAGDLFVSFNDGDARSVSRFNGEKFDLVKPNFPFGQMYFGSGWKQTVWQDSAGDWWFPTGHGLFRFSQPKEFADLNRITPQKIDIDTKSNEIYRIFEDSHDNIWISASGTATNELWRWERKNNIWHDHSQEAGFGKNRIGLSFVEDKSGNLWIGTGESDSALIRYRDGQFKIFSRADGVPEGWMRDLFVDHLDRLWIANPAVGVLRIDDVNADELNFTRYTPAEGLSSIGVSCLTEDEFGRIYIGTGRGLDRLTPETGQIENFTTADGLPNSFLEVAFRDKKNNLWFGTANGLAKFVPEPVRQRQTPNVFITGLRVSGVVQPISILGETVIPLVELESNQRQVTVDFLGLGASLGENLRYEYRFGESDWTRTNERTVNFTNLGAGKYQFEVRAQTADRLYSQPAVFSFRIAAPIWQRWWFIGLAVILIGLMIYFVYRSRLSRLLEVAGMRMRIATDLHDDIGANLTKIAILSEVAQQQLGEKIIENGKVNLLVSVAEISRESVSAMGDIVWAINPKKDSLIGLTRRMRQYAEEILERREIRLEFVAPAPETDLKLDADIRRNIYLIFKESVNNIVRHSNADAVKIDFVFADNELILQISDDGKGFDTLREYDGNGLLSIKKRAEDCGGNLEIESVEGAGTKIILRVKIKSASWIWN